MIVALIIDIDDPEAVDSLETAAEWDEGIVIRHPDGAESPISKFVCVTEPTRVDDRFLFSVPVEDA